MSTWEDRERRRGGGGVCSGAYVKSSGCALLRVQPHIKQQVSDNLAAAPPSSSQHCPQTRHTTLQVVVTDTVRTKEIEKSCCPADLEGYDGQEREREAQYASQCQHVCLSVDVALHECVCVCVSYRRELHRGVSFNCHARRSANLGGVDDSIPSVAPHACPKHTDTHKHRSRSEVGARCVGSRGAWRHERKRRASGQKKKVQVGPRDPPLPPTHTSPQRGRARKHKQRHWGAGALQWPAYLCVFSLPPGPLCRVTAAGLRSAHREARVNA